MLSIAVIPASYPTQGRPLDGIFVRDHARAAARDSQVAVLVNEERPPPPRRLYAVDDGIEDGLRTFRIRHLRIPQLGTAGYLLGILTALARLRREGRAADLLHAHVHRAAWTAMIVRSVTRLPVVVSEHSSEFASSGISPGALRRARISLPRADLVCPVSEYLRAQIEAHGIEANFRVVPNAVDTDLFSARRPPAAATHPARMIAVAALQPMKGVQHLLEALGRLAPQRSDFVLDVVGDGPCRAEYEELARRAGLAERVVFHGLQPKPIVASLMQSADFLVLPSLGETFSVVVAEAMACGLPVLATRVGGVPELVDERTGVLVEPGSAEALRAGIDHMLDHHGEYPRELIRERATSRYSLDAIGDTWTAVYRSVLSRG
jgi:glycosyltransferase involved in cell wall biosynthesis